MKETSILCPVVGCVCGTFICTKPHTEEKEEVRIASCIHSLRFKALQQLEVIKSRYIICSVSRGLARVNGGQVMAVRARAHAHSSLSTQTAFWKSTVSCARWRG